MDTGDVFEVELGAIAHGGACVGRHEGRVVFVRHGVPGERVRVEVEGFGPRGRFATARLLEVLEPSPSRRPHPWPLADALRRELPVGGVDYGHLLPEAQRELKAEVLREQLTRLGGIPGHDPAVRDLRVPPAEPEEDGSGAAAHRTVGDGAGEGGSGWRTRVHFAVDDAGRPGMHPHHSSDVVPIEEFPLAVPAINALGLWRGRWPGVERIDVAAPADGGRPLIQLTVRADADFAATVPLLDEALAACLPEGADVSAVARPAAVPGRARGTRPDPVTLRGDDAVTETVADPAGGPDAPRLAFRVGAGASGRSTARRRGCWRARSRRPPPCAPARRPGTCTAGRGCSPPSWPVRSGVGGRLDGRGLAGHLRRRGGEPAAGRTARGAGPRGRGSW
ncbi:TRAM domain-containing protein [Rothia santali]|uniref:TRAM domain-containing protein n=1 Tax=Rothia santali TaxID=2949643 RepID=UPI0035A0B9EF